MTARALAWFDARPEQVAAIDDFLLAFGAENAVPERIVHRARVCAAELAANALEHGHAKGGVDRIMVALEWGAGRSLELTYADTTARFDPSREPDVAADPGDGPGGRGLKLIRGLPSAISYSYDGTLNTVRLHFPSDAA